MVKISVVIPVYNAEPFLDEAINSLLNQSLDDFELIFVNDGSKDNSLNILKKYAEDDSRFIIIDQDNAGCGAARNRALSEATGDYIYFFDPDDYVLPNAFEKLYENAISNDSDLVIFKIARFRYKGDIDYSKPGFNFDKVFKNEDFDNFTFNYKDVKKYVLNSSFAPWSKLYKREFLDRYDDFRFDLGVAFDDVPFHVKSMLRAKRLSFVPDFFYHYRFNPNSVNNTSSNGMDIFRICDIIEAFLKRENYYDEFIEEFKLFKIAQILNYILSTDSQDYFEKAKEEFMKIDLGSSHLLSDNLLRRYGLVLKSDDYADFKRKDYDLLIENLENTNEKLVKKLDKLTEENKELKEHLNSLENKKSSRLSKFFK